MYLRLTFAKVQDGSTEQGKVTKGATTVTYIYKELGSYVPYIPGEPDKEIPNVPYDDTPEEPNDNPPLPYIPGYTPKDPSTGEPLRPVDPTDPTKGYIPPTISDPNDPSKDTPVPYEKDPEPEKAPITLEKQTNDGQKPNDPGAEMSLNQPQTQPTMNRETLNKPAMQANEAKELPQTGENEASGLASLGVLSIMAGSLGLFFRHKKDDEKTN